MSRRVVEVMQHTDEWLQARCGIITASEVHKLLTATRQTADNATSRGLVLKLAGERITGNVDPEPISGDMWRGLRDEPFARAEYARHHASVEEVGLIVCDDWGFDLGCSPDGLVGEHGLIEIKSRTQKRHLATILADEVPAENMAQIQCGLLVTGRAWLDYVSYCGGMPLWVKRVEPDPECQAAIASACIAAEQAIAATIARYRPLVDGLPLTERTPDDIEV